MSNLRWVNGDMNVQTCVTKSHRYSNLGGNILRNQFWRINILPEIEQGGSDLLVSQQLSRAGYAFNNVAPCYVASCERCSRSR